MNNKIIGINIKKYRKAAGLTQEKLAELLNISTVHMSHIECGHVSMSLELLLKLCEFLQITPNQILDGTYQSSVPTDSSIFAGMNERTTLLALRILELLRNYEKENANPKKI